MQRSSKIAVLLNIEPGEVRTVLLMLSLYFCIGIAFNFTQTAAFALFLAQFSARTLSYVYIINAIVVSLLTAASLRLGRRIPFDRMLAITLAFLLAAILLSRLFLSLPGVSWPVFVLPVLFQILINFGNLVFWPLANRIFTVRQSKRLFGVIGAGQWIAIVLTGFVMGTLASLLGTANLLLLGALGMAGAIILLLYITRSYSTQIASPAAEPTAGKQAEPLSIKKLVQTRYILLIFALIAVWWIAFFLLDNLFYDRAAARFPDPQQLSTFLGFYLSGVGILTLFANFILAGRVISRYGLRISLVVLPILLFAAAGLLSLLGTIGAGVLIMFWLTIAAKLLDMSLGLSVDRSVQSILYQPLPIPLRGQAQSFAEGMVQPVANGLTGVILLALSALFSSGTLPLIYTLFIISAVWSLTAYLLGKEYPQMLVKALARRRLDGTDLDFSDAASLAILQQNLQNPHPGPALYAASLLENSQPGVLQNTMPALLRHPAPAVRQYAFNRISQLNLVSALPLARQQMRVETIPDVRQSALRTVLSMGAQEDIARAGTYLENPIPQVRVGAITGLLRSERMEAILMAGQKLMELSRSPDPANRILAARVLGEAGLSYYYQPLLELLADPNPQVQRAALQAAGRIGSPRLWPVVITFLSSPSVGGAAASALVGGGPVVIPELVKTFLLAETSPQVKRALVSVCGRIGGPEAERFLEDQINVPDLSIRSQVFYALNRLEYRAAGQKSMQIETQIKAEAAHYRWLSAVLADLEKTPGIEALRASLAGQLKQTRERILVLLSFIRDRKTVLRARENLDRPEADKRAYAMEIIDNLLPQELKPLILPLLDDASQPPLQQDSPRAAHTTPELEKRLQEIMFHPAEWNHPWSTACALYCAGELHLENLAGTAAELCSSSDPLISKAAVWASQMFANGKVVMLSTIEKVLILKKVSIFAETPDDILAEVAQALEEVEAKTGECIFEKGEPGDSMYMIANGKIRVFDGARTLNYLSEGDVFGEMALLDPEPRVASIEAMEDSLLLRMDQEGLYELIESRAEVARGIIHVLSRHLRNRLQDLSRLQNVLERPVRT